MNCCDQSAPTSGCNQGRDCPVRATRITSEPLSESARVMDAYWHNTQGFATPPTANQTHSCQQLGACQGRADCECANSLALGSALATPTGTSPVPPEAGNVWFVDSELTPATELNDADDWRPLTTHESIIVGTLMAVFCVSWLALIAAVLGYGWGAWLSAWAGEATRAMANGLLS